MSVREKLERFKWYDLQFKITLNPLNWSMSFDRYVKGITMIAFGPFCLLIYYG